MEWTIVDGWQADYLRPRNIDVGRIDPLRLASPIKQPGPEPEAVEEAVPDEDAEEAVEDAAE